MIAPDRAALAARLSRLDGFAGLAPEELTPLPQKGLVHVHYRVGRRLPGGGVALLRVPRLAAFGMAPAENLAYQAASFTRAALSGHVPRLHVALTPDTDLPMGALLIDAVDGRSVRLPEDLGALAEALAAVHRLPVPPPPDRTPLADHADPVSGSMRIIEQQAVHVAAAVADADARAMIAEELDWARAFAAAQAGQPQPASLVLSDTHPGNFLVDRDGRAWFVDIEKVLYGSPAVDLAHATLLTSTTWDIDVQAELSDSAVAGFYRAYLEQVGDRLAGALRPWLMAMRRLTWLRTTTWSCRWRIEQGARPAAGTADDRRLLDHIAGRLALFVDPARIARIRREWLGPNRLELG